MSQENIRLLIVDDHPLFRQGGRLFLREAPGIHLAGEAGKGEEALLFLEKEPVDVVLMDLQMPGMDGIEATGRILAQWPDVKVLILTSFGSWQKACLSLKTGACGYVLKDAQPEELVAAILAVAAGGSYLSAPVAHAMINHLNSTGETEIQHSSEHLTEREKEVLVLVARGFGNREIAQQIYVSEKTVKTHVANILQKLGVRSRTQAALYAMRTGLIKEEDCGA
ncbi:MAG: response regulator transcription factor [Bacillota bacterium]|nr:response regulator transcription factor [Bacillota bacterium]MDW7683561.1 response regulator transcription factor [Bacillota bacterium]